MWKTFQIILTGVNTQQFNTPSKHSDGILILEAVHRHSSDGAAIPGGRDLYAKFDHGEHDIHTNLSMRSGSVPLFFNATTIGNNFPTPRLVISTSTMAMDKNVRLALYELDNTTLYTIAANEEFVFTFSFTKA